MNFSKKNKSTNKGQSKTIMSNYINSFSNKYPTYLQSSLNEDNLLLKKKLKGYSKIHSHSSNNTNKNIENNKKPSMASNINGISPISPINNYFLKKKNDIYINKPIKNNLMLTSINNSSLIYTSKDKEKYNNNKNSSFRGINSKICYNYNLKKNINKNKNNIYSNNPYEKKMKFNYNNKESKKYSMTSINSRQTSKEKEKKPEDIHNMNKLKFNGLFNNYIINDGKHLNNNYMNNNKIIKENNYIKNNNNINSNSSNNSSLNKKLFVCDFSNLKKGKLLNDFLESYLKGSQSNNRKIKNKYNNYSISNANSIINININSTKNINSTANNSLIKNNYFPSSSSNYSPNNGAEFFKTAKISPRASFPKKKQDFIQSHRINIKNKLQGNILSFYNNYKNNNTNNIYSNNSNVNINLDNNNISSHLDKKKKHNMSVNMNVTYNNKNFNMSNLIKNKNRSMMNSEEKIDSNINYNGNKENKSNSLNKVNNNINFIGNYNFNYNLINKNNNNFNGSINNNHNSSNNSFIKSKKNQNPIMNGNNIINNCKININNINYNNYNNDNNIINYNNYNNVINNINNNNNTSNNSNNNCNSNDNNNNNNHIFNDKIYQLFKKKALIDLQDNKPQNNRISSQSQQEITQIKKNKNKNFTSNSSPVNKNINSKNKNSSNSGQNNIKLNNNNNINTYSGQNIKKNNSLKAKENKKIKYEIKPKDKSNNNSLLFDNKIYEILELKHNLQKNNSEINVSSEKKEKKKEIQKKIEKEKDKDKDKENYNINYNNKNTISNLSSTTHDSNYYMEKCNSLSKYIRDYYRRYNKYPNTNLNFYLYGRLIGQGAFGKVNIGLNILTGRVVAIKSFNKKSLSTNGDNMKKILSETDLMKKLNHPNVTKILEMFEDDEYILIAMEYINGGNLFSFVKKRRKLSEKTAKFLFKQIILGIKHIHSKKIVHRDIKLENILIDLNNNIKICDFGIGRILKSEKQLLYDKCGTPMYMAPEILLSSKTKGYEGYPVDIWSSGISLYIMLSGTLPFNLKNNESSEMSDESNSNSNNIELQYSIINKEPKKVEKISDEARDLLKGLLNKNPKRRLTIEQILNHPWLMDEEKNNNKKKNKKYHLFTKAEMIMLSKTYIDYRNGLIEDLKENFTISNLKLENKENPEKNKKLKNITTKSSLLAPYNTLIQNEESLSEDYQDEFDDLANPKIKLENEILVINNKAKEFNLNYELNNNGECDNGMLINTKTDTISSANNQSQISSRNENEDDLDDNSDNDENEDEHEKKTEKILEEIEKIGYDRKYVMNCVKNNELCHASAIFYLMMNYKDI